MSLKDYYSILGVAANAGPTEIKKAYRQQALIYHPDRNRENPYAAAYFQEIREAYETLSNPVRKDHYLQQRWYQLSLGKKFASIRPLTVETVLGDCIHLNKYVRSLNAFRIDQPGLADYINNLLSSTAMQTLKVVNDRDANSQICHLLLEAITPLDLIHCRHIIIKLLELSVHDMPLQEKINRKMNEKKSITWFRRYEITIIVLITFLICLVMWLAAK